VFNKDIQGLARKEKLKVAKANFANHLLWNFFSNFVVVTTGPASNIA